MVRLRMLRLSDFVTCRKRFNNQSGGCISGLLHCRKMKFRTYLHPTVISKIYLSLSRLSDLVAYGPSLYIWSRALYHSFIM